MLLGMEERLQRFRRGGVILQMRELILSAFVLAAFVVHSYLQHRAFQQIAKDKESERLSHDGSKQRFSPPPPPPTPPFEPDLDIQRPFLKENSELFPTWVDEYVSERVASRLKGGEVAKRCEFEKLQAMRLRNRWTFGKEGALHPITWICKDKSRCQSGLGDQFKALAYVFYQGLAIGYDLVAKWEHPIPLIPDLVSPRDPATWDRLLAAYEGANESEIFTVSRDSDSAGNQLCRWTEYKGVAVTGHKPYHKPSNRDCSDHYDEVKDLVRNASTSTLGLGCMFWGLFQLGEDLQARLKEALERFGAWKVTLQRTRLPVIAVHFRAGDKFLGINSGFSGDLNPLIKDLMSKGQSAVEEMFKCATLLEQRLGLNNATFLFISDRAQSRKEAVAWNPKRVYTTSASPYHAGLSSLKGEDEGPYTSVWIDMLLASLADAIVVSPSTFRGTKSSGFSLVSSEVGMFRSEEILSGWECFNLPEDLALKSPKTPV